MELTDVDRGLVSCDPWQFGHNDSCAADEAHFPGEPDCATVGTPCSADNAWASDLPTDPLPVYVLAGAPAGGDGTTTEPYGTIGEAIDNSSVGSIVALSKGTFAEEVFLPDGVTLWGACVAETVVTQSVPGEASAVINAGGRDSTVRNMRITGSRPGIWVGPDRSMALRDVVVSGCAFHGLAVPGGELSGEKVVVRDTRGSLVRPGLYGRGLTVQGGTVSLTRAVFERNHYGGVSVSSGGSGYFSDLVIRESLVQEADSTFGRGLSIYTGGTAVVQRAAVERNHDVGIYVSDEGSYLTLADAVVRDTFAEQASGEGGFGIWVGNGAEAHVVRASVERNRDAGMSASGNGTYVTVEDAIVRTTSGRGTDGWAGRGIQAEAGATFLGERLAVQRNREVGVYSAGAGTAVSVSDLAVYHTMLRECASSTCAGIGAGIGAGVYDDGSLSLTRFILSDNPLAGAVCAAVAADDLISAPGRYTSETVLRLSEGDISWSETGVLAVGCQHVRIEGVSIHDVGSGVLPIPVPRPPI